MINKIVTLSGVAGILTVFRHAPAAWEIDPLSTLIAGLCVIIACAGLILDAFKKGKYDNAPSLV